MMGRLDDKVALISGGARGTGASEVKLFAQEGAKVIFGDILDDDGKRVEAEVAESGAEATYVHLDVTNEDDWRRAVELAERRYSKLEILVNNAGITIPADGIDNTSEEDWDRVMAVNAKGVFLGTKTAIPAMRRAGGGAIVNISSVAGIVGGPFPLGSYGPSKAAVRSLSKDTAIQHAKDNIRCNSVHPGPIDTSLLWQSTTGREQWNEVIPLGRVGQTGDVAFGVLYLASDESAFVTGAELIIDGGILAQ